MAAVSARTFFHGFEVSIIGGGNDQHSNTGHGGHIRKFDKKCRSKIARAIKVALEGAKANQSSESQNRRLVRAFLLVDLGAVGGSLLGNRHSTSMATETLTEVASEPVEDHGRQGRGRGVLSKLVLFGVIIGLGAILRTRLGSRDQVVTEATDRAQSVADETAMRSGEAAGRTEAITEKTAGMIETGGETAAEGIEAGSTTVADRIRVSGEQTADQIEGVGETVENVEEKVEESASGKDNESEQENGE